MKRRRAFLLPLALMLATLFGVIGGAFLQSQANLYAGSAELAGQLMARNLAEIGVVDARAKYQRDVDFPPAGSDEQTEYAYTEPYLDPISGQRMGSYTVVVDQTHIGAPYYVLSVRSTGSVQSGEKYILKTVIAEYDICPFERDHPSDANSDYMQLLNWVEP